MKKPTSLPALLIALILSFTFVNGIAQLSNLDNFIEDQLETHNIPGLAACVMKNGAIVWEGAYGFTDLDNNIAVNSQTLFTIASLSKLVASTAIMQLEESGQLELDEDVDNYLDFEISNPNFPDEPITIRQLLRHRSSLKDSESLLFDSWQQGDSPIELEDYVRDYVSVEGDFFNPAIFNNNTGPGQSTWYSNYGFALLGYLVETISGMPYHAYCKSAIFEPLCMDHTTFFFSELDASQYAIPHSYSGSNQGPLGLYSIANYPAALLKTNIEDLSHFLIAYTQRGTMDGVSILSNESVDQLTPYDFSLPNLGWWNGTSWTYSFYFPDEEVWYHGGFMPGVRARMNYYPQDSSGIIILTNGEGQYRYVEDTLQSYIPAFTSVPADTLPCAISTSFKDSELTALDFDFYPNPVSDLIYLDWDLEDWTYLEVRDITGSLIFRKDAVQRIDCSQLPSGCYFLTGYCEKGQETRRFVKR